MSDTPKETERKKRLLADIRELNQLEKESGLLEDQSKKIWTLEEVIGEQDRFYFIEYGKAIERIRILDLITNSDFEPAVKTDLRKLIKDIEDTHPEQDFGMPKGKEI